MSADLDRETLRALAGVADLSKPRLVEHFLYVPSREAGEQAAEALAAHGYAANVEEAVATGGEEEAVPPWLVLASKTAVVDERSVREARDLFEGLAVRHGGEYDGWGAEGDEKPPPSKGWRRLLSR